MTKILTLAEVCSLPNESWVTGFSATCISLEAKTSTKTGKNFWKVQWADADGGIRVSSTLFTFPKFKQGDQVEVSGQSIKFSDGQYGKEIKIGDKAQIIAFGGQQPPTPAQAPAAGEGDFHPTPRAQTPTQAPKAATETGKPVFGATVGMAMNLAVESLTKGLEHKAIAERLTTEAFHEAVHQVASDFIRTSARLERGDLAPATKEAPPF